MPLDPPDLSGKHVVRGACPHDCPDTCALLTTVENGRAIAIRGAPDHPATGGVLCTKVARYLERTYSDQRVLYPQRRIGRKGEGRFERISWDEALDTIATRFSAIAASAAGPQAILPYSYAGTMGLLQYASMDRRFFPSPRRVAARPHDLRVGRQGRLGCGHRRVGRHGRRAIREQPADRDLGQQSDRVQPAFLDARAGSEAARREADRDRSLSQRRPPKSATSTSRCCPAPTRRLRLASCTC
jgi:hypothetical protein